MTKLKHHATKVKTQIMTTPIATKLRNLNCGKTHKNDDKTKKNQFLTNQILTKLKTVFW